MKCPYCSTPETKVIDSRLNQTADMTRRRRECLECGGRFTTYERIEEVMPNVIKKDGRREPFVREKIFSGIQKSVQKRPVTTTQIESAVVNIEKLIQSYGLKEIPSKSIGEMVMAALLQLDKVAYVRFASVYREFRDVDEFVNDLNTRAISPTSTFEGDRENLAFPFLVEENPPRLSEGKGPEGVA
ncbi:MAG: transcriptional repressor NrdR [Bdellovibrionales bacterium]|nr:transcriptional repressor NrdR [Bdellovibrionales bacterium]